MAVCVPSTQSDRRDAVGSEGYVYVQDNEEGPMTGAAPGAVARTPGSGSRWIVVDEEPSNAVLAKWPGKLWRVRILEAAPPRDQPLPYARYQRARAVQVLAEESPAILFGEHGEQIVMLLDRANSLTRAEAEMLSMSRHPGAPAAYHRTFDRWAKATGRFVDEREDLDGVLRLGGPMPGSPVNEGLSLLAATVSDRAETADGESAFHSNEEDLWLVAPWDGANRVFGDAALGLGAPQFTSERDAEVLLTGWNRLIGA